MDKIELLAPAGNKECFLAAVNNGADAIYVGGKNFSARANADNFTNEELGVLIRYAHIRGVKVHVGINIMLYEEEIKDVLDYIDFLYLHDIDALIISDLGLISLVTKRYPSLEIHASTQLNTHSLWQVKYLESLNVARIVLARETSSSTIKYIKDNSNIDLEVFAHGALCVCYSGNCLHSSMIGKRSGNRGMCAQPCRMEYSLLENGKNISSKKYLLSMKDLNTLENIDRVIQSGVISLKIEGRMKSAEYVALVVSTYRKAIDKYYEGATKFISENDKQKLALTFSRTFTKGYILNDSNQNLTNTFRPGHIGEKIGYVYKSFNGKVQIKLTNDIHQKDKIVFINNYNDDVGIYLSKIIVHNKMVSQGYKGEIIEIPLNSRVDKEAEVFKVVDNALVEKINETYLSKIKKMKIRMRFVSNVGSPLMLNIKDDASHSIIVKSEYIVEEAINLPTSKEKVQEQLLRLASTPYDVDKISIELDGKGIVPSKCINDLRRDAIEKLSQMRANFYHRSQDEIVTDTLVSLTPYRLQRKLKVKVKNIYQLEAIAAFNGVNEIYYDDMFTFKLAKEKYPQLNLIPVLNRIHNDKSKVILDSKTYVTSNLGDVLEKQDSRIKTDMYLNIANSYSVAQLLQSNVEEVTLSGELNKNQITCLIEGFKTNYGFLPPLEMVVFGRYQTMVSKYCFISKELGYERKNCGACRKNSYELVDRISYHFPVLTDLDCNVTIFNSKTLNLIDYVNEIYELGISSLRLDFSIESPQEVAEVVQAYLDKIQDDDYQLNIKNVTYGYYLD